MADCTKCGNEIVSWYALEIWSGEQRPILNKHPDQLCNACAFGCDGILSFADHDEMLKYGEQAKKKLSLLSTEELQKLFKQYGIPEGMSDGR